MKSFSVTLPSQPASNTLLFEVFSNRNNSLEIPSMPSILLWWTFEVMALLLPVGWATLLIHATQQLKISSTKKTIIFTEVFCKYMQVSMKRQFRIWNKVQVSCIQTKFYTRKTSSQIMKKIWHSLKIMLAKQVARQTSRMLVSVH